MSADEGDIGAWRMPAAAMAPWNNLEEQRRNSKAARTQAASEIVDRAKAEQQTTSDYAGRYPIELVQNAHDAAGGAGRAGRAWIELTDTALLVANDGKPFDERRVTALMRYGDSPKDADKSGTTEIGYKGIGFSAVFDVTDNPQILSGGYGFQLHRHRARTGVEDILGVPVERVPVRGYPLELMAADFAEDVESIRRLFADGAVTVIRLPLLDQVSPDAVRDACGAVLGRRTLLFLPNLRQLELRGELGLRSWSRRLGKQFPQGRVMHLSDGDNRESWLVARATVPVTEAEVARLSNDVWADIRSLNVAVAVPWSGSHPAPSGERQRLHVYFPTEVELGRGLIVQGDFFVDSSRKHLLQDVNCGPLNVRLAVAAGLLAAAVVEELTASSGAAGLGVLDQLGDASPFAAEIWKTTLDELRQREIIPTRDGLRVLPRDANFVDPDDRAPGLVRAAIADGPGRVPLRFEEHVAACNVLFLLEATPLSPAAIAQRLTPETIDADYGDWLRALEAWIGQLTGIVARSVITALRGRPVVQRARDGGWALPSTVVRRDIGIPKLPTYAHRDEVQTHANADDVLDRLDVDRVDLGSAVDLVLDDLASLEDATDAEREAALRFFRQAWNANARGLAEATGRLAEVLVPVRPARPGAFAVEESAWLPAGVVYFDTDWQDDSVAAAVYGPLGLAEFLAVAPPRTSSTRSQHRRFFGTLGVSSSPHLMTPSDSALAGTIDRWQKSPEWQSIRCPDGHSDRYLEVTSHPASIERLDLVLGGTSAAGLAAVRRFLLQREPPLGPSITVRCNHGWHPRPRNRTTESLDHWLLRTSAWLPVIGSQDNLASPDDCWTEVVGRANELDIQICALDERDARPRRAIVRKPATRGARTRALSTRATVERGRS